MRADVLVGGKYRLVRAIGAGGMGTVWLARNEMTEREFAIKFLHAHAASSPKMLQRFFQEARVSGKLRHPSILEIFDVGTAAELHDAPYLVMEMLDGAPLDSVLRRLGRLPLGVALEVAATIARAMAIAHDKGIVHRDLKPANVFLHRPGTGAVVPKVLDFGISKILSQPETGPSLGLTQTGAVLGSPLYMSPEQVEGLGDLDARSDVYSLAIVLWECLLGRAPYRATNYNVLVAEKLAAERPRLRDALPGAPPALDALVQNALTRDRDRRKLTARGLADALDGIRAALGLSAVLDRPTAAQWLFSQLNVPSAPPDAPPLEDTSTTGAVSVPRGPAPTDPSPHAYTVQPGEGRRELSRPDPDASPFAPTILSEERLPASPAAARSVTTGGAAARTVGASLEPPTPAPRSTRAARIGAGAAVVVVAALGAWKALAPRTENATASPTATPSIQAEPKPTATPAVPLVAAPSTPAATVTPPAAPVLPTPVPPAPAATRPARAPAANAPTHHGAPAAHVARDAGAPSANRGIVDDGL